MFSVEFFSMIALLAIAVNLQILWFNIWRLRKLAEKYLSIKSDDY